MKALHSVRILYVNHTGQVSGAERVLLNMVRGLDKAHYEPVVACPEGQLAQILRAEGIAHLAIPAVQARFSSRLDHFWKAMLSVGRSVLAARRVVFRLQPEIVHANTVRAGIVASLASAGTRTKLIWHVHDTLPRHPISTAIRLLALVSPKTHFVAVSNAVATAFRGRFHLSSRLTTLYNGTDLCRFPPKDENSRRFRQKIGVPQDAFMVCAVGQICARKGQVELVRAFRRIEAAAPSMHLVVAGSLVFEHERGYFEQLQRVASEAKLAGRLHMVGEVDEVPALLRASDLLVLNSLDEPFGLVLVEAMSSATAVLAARTGGVPEIVHDAHDGWLVEPGDEKGLSRKLLYLSENRELLDETAAVALAETCQRFSLERFQVKLQGLYEELLSRRHASPYERSQQVVAEDSAN